MAWFRVGNLGVQQKSRIVTDVRRPDGQPLWLVEGDLVELSDDVVRRLIHGSLVPRGALIPVDVVGGSGGLGIAGAVQKAPGSIQECWKEADEKADGETDSPEREEGSRTGYWGKKTKKAG